MKTALFEKTLPARSISELFALHDESFVRCAYQTVLGRDADPSGLEHFTECLRAGTAKIDILHRLRQSDEASQLRLDLGWLDSAITHRHRAMQRPFGWLFRFSRAGERNDPQSNKVRAIDNNLNRLCVNIVNIEDRLARLERSLDRMEFKLDRQKDALLELLRSSIQSTQAPFLPLETEAPNRPGNALSPQSLSPRASRVLSRLRAAANPSPEI